MTLPETPATLPLTGEPAPARLRPLLDLSAFYPACFNWTAPRPLKIGIFAELRADLCDAGYSGKAIRLALKKYCTSDAYLAAMCAGVPRIDLQGQPMGAVTADQAAVAAGMLAHKQSRPPKPPRPPAPPQPVLPADTPLTQENIVSGRLELTVKFSQLPKPVAVKAGMKIGIQTDTALVVATLPPKAWKKLEKAQAEWPQWSASMTGKLGAKAGADAGSVVVLEQPALQVFEKKPKPAPDA